MKILGINTGHHSSICLLNDGEVELFIENERLSHKKYDSSYDKCLTLIDKVDYIAMSSYAPIKYNKNNSTGEKIHFIDAYNNLTYSTMFDNKLLNSIAAKKVLIYSHHICHAYHAFYNSEFNNSICVVADGWGSIGDNELFETESIYHIEYPHKADLLYKNYVDLGNLKKPFGIGLLYSNASNQMGFKEYEEGKAMGIAPYNSYKDYIPEELKTEEYLKKIEQVYKTQQYTQLKLLQLIKKAIKETGCKNVCLSGGYVLNVVANYFIKKNLPSDVNLYCEPLANDSGQSVGAAKYLHHFLTKDTTMRPQKSLYLGPNPEY